MAKRTTAKHQVLQLAPPSVSADTCQILEELLSDALRGEAIGVAFVALYRDRQYIVDVAGECARQTIFTRGLVRALDDRLATNGDGSFK